MTSDAHVRQWDMQLVLERMLALPYLHIIPGFLQFLFLTHSQPMTQSHFQCKLLIVVYHMQYVYRLDIKCEFVRLYHKLGHVTNLAGSCLPDKQFHSLCIELLMTVTVHVTDAITSIYNLLLCIGMA